MVAIKARPRCLRLGFTLIELLVVMAALIVLAAVTLPSIKGLLHDQKVTAASRMVASHISAAQSRAIATGRPVAAILERNANDPDVVTRLAIGSTFPPYQGDFAPTFGTLADVSGDGFYDRISVPRASVSLLEAAVVGLNDFIQIGDRGTTFRINAVNIVGTDAVIDFMNPPMAAGYVIQETQLPARIDASSTFKIYRKPTKSFVQSSVLPRGTCIDLSVSGIGAVGNEFASSGSTLPLMIVFGSDGSVVYVSDGTMYFIPTSMLHLLVGRVEQVSLSNPLSVEDPSDSSTFDANLNDNANFWLSINPFTDAIYSSTMHAGSEGSTFPTRLKVARTFATSAVTQTEN